MLRSRGLKPLSPAPGDPDWDIAWRDADEFCVCEVKSLSDSNEERQLRLALGQVLRYRQRSNHSSSPAHAIVATSRQPRDASWEVLLESLGISLVWPGAWEKLWT